MQLTLAITPQERSAVSRLRCPLAHMAYGIDENGRLTRSLATLHGGLLMLHDRNGRFPDEPAPLCHAILYECQARGFQGVVLDFQSDRNPHRLSFLRQLDTVLAQNERRLYVPLWYADSVSQAKLLFCTALSGGTLREYLEETVHRWGAERLALDLQRICMDFQLPCPSGEGTALSPSSVMQEIQQKQITTFYSGELCARYFTKTIGKEHHFILFDDASTLRRKIQLAENFGISEGFFMYPEVSDLLPQLFG